jgi:GTP-binding protein
MAIRDGENDRHGSLRRRQDPPDLQRAQPRLIGYHGEFLSDTRAPCNHEPLVRDISLTKARSRAAKTACSSRWSSEASRLRPQQAEERGILFIAPGEKLYEGMIIGENAKPQDLEVNP